MKPIIALVMVLFALVSHADVTKGTITSANGLTLATSAQKFGIPKGTSSFAIDTKFNLFGLNDVVLVVNGKTFLVPAPKHVYNAFKNHGNFRVSAQELGANFGMVARNSSSVIKKENKNASEACTFCGYCFGVNPSNGQMEYGFNASCSGTREFLAEITYYKTIYQIDFTDKSGKVVGTFLSSPIVTDHKKEIKEIRSCL